MGMSPNGNPQPNNFAALGKNAFWPESVLLCVVRDCLEEGVKDEPQASSSNSPCSLFLRYAFAKCRREFPCRRKDPCGMSMEGTCPPLLSLSLRAFSSARIGGLCREFDEIDESVFHWSISSARSFNKMDGSE